MEYIHKVDKLGSDINYVFNQKLLYDNEKDIQIVTNIALEKEEAPLQYYCNKNFMEVLEEDNEIYSTYLEGGDYEKLLTEKKEREKQEQEERNRQVLTKRIRKGFKLCKKDSCARTTKSWVASAEASPNTSTSTPRWSVWPIWCSPSVLSSRASCSIPFSGLSCPKNNKPTE